MHEGKEGLKFEKKNIAENVLFLHRFPPLRHGSLWCAKSQWRQACGRDSTNGAPITSGYRDIPDTTQTAH